MSSKGNVYFGLSVLVLAVVAVLDGAIYMLAAGAFHGPVASSPGAVAERLKPVGEVTVAQQGEAQAPAGAATPAAAGGAATDGKTTYEKVCVACHATGVAGAPKFGDKAAWEPRAAKGIDALMHSATNGLNAMPPKGTCATCSDADLKAAIEYMVGESGASLGGGSAAAPAAAPAPAAAAPAAPEAAAAGGADGKAIYERVCHVCHAAGVAGAPKFGDKAAWAPRIAKGIDGLLHSATNGLNAMPPKGTCMDCSEADLKAAIGYMTSNSE